MKRREKVLFTIGYMCKQHRERLGEKQSRVAEDTGYSEQNVSSFETGRTNNMILLLWYIDHGVFDMGNRLILHKLLRSCDNENN